MDENDNEKETFLLVKKGDKGSVLYVELSPNRENYNVNSGGVFKNTYINKRGLLWNVSTEHSTPSAVAQDFPPTQLNTESGEVSALSQSNSFDKSANGSEMRLAENSKNLPDIVPTQANLQDKGSENNLPDNTPAAENPNKQEKGLNLF
ncbi:MAG: hypothetical protein LBK18_02985 [Prevotellaceae bacterium]|jgi:hypothetical protein|nr:hypothetical protein [Prevotellaceae bacterium]